jgi:hypothetical protein
MKETSFIPCPYQVVEKSQNLLKLDIKAAAGKKAAPVDQSLKVQSKPIFDPFSSEPPSPTTLLVTQDDGACGDSVVEKTDTTTELSRH